ncbi:hypothetical protein AU252_10145 [Pseudarthrobacter sulfonivorans]|uniref:Uncharacterized protein n=1 Tax=Pseudarthrobacter sulfonivorans TaxID=121292 RepID=A0A0U3Q8C5_9MICC|nr:hypothetical protein [Pseudarthrobacter sulfonivorans]ALV41466.1 hypothetical protein AU252_10145 [Pseudarthrobacter sulfonivorans]
MSNPFTVAAEETARKTGSIDAVVASLPISLANATLEPDIVALDGSKTGWPERAQEALDRGARATVVISPTSTTGPAPKTSSRILFDWAFASNPAVQKAAEAADRLVAPVTLLESRLVVPAGVDLNQVLLDQLTAIAHIVGENSLPPGSIRRLHADEYGYQMSGTLAGGAPVTVSAVVTGAEHTHLEIRLLTQDESITVFLPAPDTAIPAEVRMTTHEGELLLPTQYESAHRSTWRRAIRTLSEEAETQDFATLQRAVAVMHP